MTPWPGHQGKIECEPGVIEGLGLDTADDPLGVGHQRVELLIGSHVELPETLKELREILNGGVPKYLGPLVILAREPLGEVADQLGQLRGERLFGQTYGFIETGLDPLALFLVELRVELLEIRGRLDRGEVEVDGKQVHQGVRVVGGAIEAAQPLSGGRLQVAVVPVQVLRLGQLLLELSHLGDELFDLVLPDQTQARPGRANSPIAKAKPLTRIVVTAL